MHKYLINLKEIENSKNSTFRDYYSYPELENGPFKLIFLQFHN